MVLSRLRAGLLLCAALAYSAPALAVDPTSMTASRSGSTVSGRVVDAFGNGVFGATVYLTAVDGNGRMGVTTRSAPTGTVPAGAVNGKVGIVVGPNVPNNGACVCHGVAAVVLGGMLYAESGSGSHSYGVSVVPDPFPYPAVPLSVRTFELQPGDNYSLSFGTFAVSAGASFSFSVPVMATANAAQAGYAVLTFTDSSGHAVGTPQQIWFTPGQQILGSVNTDLSGNFSTTLAAHANLADPQLILTWAGNTIYGPSSTTVAPLGIVPANTMPSTQQPLAGLGTSSAPLIWMSPFSDFLSAVNSSGWNSVLTTQWPFAAAHTKVLRLLPKTVHSLGQDQLAQLVHDMNASGMVLELEIGPNNNYGVSCYGGESFAGPGDVNQAVSDLMSAGANLSMVGMDEPLWYGYYNTTCPNYTMADEVTSAYQLLHLWKAAFPHLIYGDIEPFPEVSNKTTWTSDLPSFITGVQQKTGIVVSFVHMDIDWDQPQLLLGSDPTMPNVPQIESLVNTVANVVRGNGMKLGVIINGNGSTGNCSICLPSDTQTWMTEAEKHSDAVAASGALPEQLAFESWGKVPTATIPERTTTALTYLIDYYEGYK
jgi:hypothetical protein